MRFSNSTLPATPRAPSKSDALHTETLTVGVGEIWYKSSKPLQASITNSMCYLESVFYLGCQHWGPDRLISEPCIRAQASGRRWSRGCFGAETIGSANSNGLCPTCEKRRSSDVGFRFADFQGMMLDSLREYTALRLRESLIWKASRALRA